MVTLEYGSVHTIAWKIRMKSEKPDVHSLVTLQIVSLKGKYGHPTRFT